MSQALIKYNNTQIVLHWVTAILIAFLLIMGHFALSAIPNSDPFKLVALKGHMIFGCLAFILTLIRLVWRLKTKQPPHAKTGSPLLDKVGTASPYLLNITTLLVAITGIGIAAQSELFNIVFQEQGVLPDNFMQYPPRMAHGILTKLLTALVVLHILGALYHQLILKDGLLSRMSIKKVKD